MIIETIKALSNLKNEHGNFVVDFDKPNVDNHTPLYMAIQNNCLDVLKFLISLRDSNNVSAYNFNNTIKAMNGKWTPLGFAAGLNQVDVLKLFFALKDENGKRIIDFNKESDGMSPIYIAARNDSAEAIKYLAELCDENGNNLIDVNKPSSNGSTSLYVALQHNCLRAIKALAALEKT